MGKTSSAMSTGTASISFSVGALAEEAALRDGCKGMGRASCGARGSGHSAAAGSSATGGRLSVGGLGRTLCLRLMAPLVVRHGGGRRNHRVWGSELDLVDAVAQDSELRTLWTVGRALGAGLAFALGTDA